MKTRSLILFALTAGIITVFFLTRTPPPPSAQEIAKAAETTGQTETPPIPSSFSELIPPLVADDAHVNSSNDETSDLVQKIQAALKTGTPADHDLVFTNLLLDLIQKDPNSAARLAESMEAGPLREEMLRRVAQHWAEQDAAAASQWAEKLSDEPERKSVLTDVCFQIAQADPEQAIKMADGYGLGSLPGAPLENLAAQWAAKDLAAATAWINERPAGEQKDQMLARAAVVMAQTTPAAAAQIVADQIPAGNVQTEAAISVVYQWARSDLPGARAWVQLFPEGPLRERALNELKGIEQYQQQAGISNQ